MVKPKKVSQNVAGEVTYKDIPAVTVKKLFRYHCPKCTGRAGYGAEPFFFVSMTCLNCGATIEYKKENWIRMTMDEVNAINGK